MRRLNKKKIKIKIKILECSRERESKSCGLQKKNVFSYIPIENGCLRSGGGAFRGGRRLVLCAPL